MTDHLSILSTLAARTVEDARHREIVSGWLKEAGFAELRPALVVLQIDSAGVWCGGASDTRAIELTWNSRHAVASVVSYAGRKVYAFREAPTPLEALRALAASGKVPRALLAP